MSRTGNYNGNLSENDALIKSLREKKGTDEKVDFKSLNASIKEKRKILKGDAIVQKDDNTQES